MQNIRTEIVLVVASARNDVIGFRGDMPWHQPADLAHFKAVTTGGVILMGRKTFESIGSRPLPNRVNLVLTRDASWSAQGARRVQSFKEACELAGERLFVIGGAQVYAEALPLADRIEWTRIEASPEGDTWFQPPAGFVRSHMEIYPADAKNQYAMTFETWLRR